MTTPINRNHIEDKLKAMIAEVLPYSDVTIEDLSREQDFSALALDSLGLAELFINIENEFNVYVSEEDAQKINTLGELIELIYQRKESDHAK